MTVSHPAKQLNNHNRNTESRWNYYLKHEEVENEEKRGRKPTHKVNQRFVGNVGNIMK